MKNRIKTLLETWFMPKWLILFVDYGNSSLAFLITNMLRYNLFSENADLFKIFIQMLAGLPFFILAISLFKQHHNIIRHSTIQDIAVLFKSNFIVTAGFVIISILGQIISESFFIPTSVIIIHFFLSLTAMIFFRIALILGYNKIIRTKQNKVNMMIYGAGDMGTVAASLILKAQKTEYNISGYIDDNPALWGNKVNGIEVHSPDETFNKLTGKLQIREVILAISSNKIAIDKKMEIIDNCIARNIKVRELYETNTWLKGKQPESKIRDINIEELLGRNVIEMPIETVKKGIRGKSVMVTGGAGSIGSEIVRQLVILKPEIIILIDQAESAVFEIQNEIKPKLETTKLKVYVSDITNESKMRRIFEKNSPQIIYHAAAYKHVPLMEEQPYEAVKNNVGGTKILADLSIEFKVEKFVMISSDKAVNPTNIMGATKRMSEIYVQSLSKHRNINTEFITTRFGNVLGSNGSVIPIFKRQISNGGPVTVTHREVIRYFMTIHEACRLVLEAGFLGKGGEIYIFDMGDPIRIYDLAVRMISLSGLVPHQDIQIVETGLRPGEKLYEELLNVKETTIPTPNEKIMIAKIRPSDYRNSELSINKLLFNIDNMDNWNLVSNIKQIIPEFISNNSEYEKLDLQLLNQGVAS